MWNDIRYVAVERKLDISSFTEFVRGWWVADVYQIVENGNSFLVSNVDIDELVERFKREWNK